MSTSSRGTEKPTGGTGRGSDPGGAGRISRDPRRRGFTLVEALVALVVAGLLLPALARAMGGAWSATRMPMDVVSGIVLARDVAEGAAVPVEARERGYSAERLGGPATVLVLPSGVAPAPRGTGRGQDAGDLHPEATPAGLRLAIPKGLGQAGAGASPPVELRRVSVTVRTPAGRRIPLETVKLVDAPR